MPQLIPSELELYLKEKSESVARLRADKYYNIIRTNMNSENTRLAQLTNWMVGSHSFLFIAYLTLLNAPEKSLLHFTIEHLNLFSWIIPSSALMVSLFAYCGMITSYFNLLRLRSMWDLHPKDETVMDYPPVQGPRHIRLMSFTAILLMPLIFIGNWVVILGFQFMNPT